MGTVLKKMFYRNKTNPSFEELLKKDESILKKSTNISKRDLQRKKSSSSA